MGTKGWFDLIYHDDPNYDYGAMKVKLEKQEARERKKLPEGMYPVGLINLEDRPDTPPSSSHQTAAPDTYSVTVPNNSLPHILQVEGLDDSNAIASIFAADGLLL